MSRELSRVEFMCDDTRLGRVLRAISAIGGIYHLKAVPVVNAERKGQAVKAKGSGDPMEAFAEFIKSHPIINAGTARKFCAESGFQPSSYSYILQKAMALGLLTKIGKGHNTAYKPRSAK